LADKKRGLADKSSYSGRRRLKSGGQMVNLKDGKKAILIAGKFHSLLLFDPGGV
jgi:hypothetical protein